MWILLASYPNLTHVNQTTRELLTNMELGPKDLRKIIYIQCFTEAQGTDGPKISLAKLLGASATDRPQKHQQICAGGAGWEAEALRRRRSLLSILPLCWFRQTVHYRCKVALEVKNLPTLYRVGQELQHHHWEWASNHRHQSNC